MSNEGEHGLATTQGVGERNLQAIPEQSSLFEQTGQKSDATRPNYAINEEGDSRNPLIGSDNPTFEKEKTNEEV